MDALREYLSQPEKFMAFDLETSGLNAEEAFIVGVALCQTPNEGVYVAINHHSGGLGQEGLDLIYEELCKRECVFVFNLRFDFRIMEWAKFKESGYLDITRSRSAGYDMSKVKYLDVAVPCFLADTNMGGYAKSEVNFKRWYAESNKQLKPMSLKHWSLHFLGWEQQKFQEVLGDSANFFYVDPQDATFYAATDALATFHLAFKTSQFMKEAGFAGKLDNSLLYPLMRMEQNTTLLDVAHIHRLREEVVPEVARVQRELMQVVAQANPSLIIPRTTPKSSPNDLDFDVNFNLKSAPQRAALFTYIGVDTGQYTPKGAMKTGKAEMEAFLTTYPPEHLAHKFADAYLTFSKLTKLDSTYIEPFLREATIHDGRTRFGYRTDRAPTTRLAGGKESKNKVKGESPFFSLMNIQSIVKPKPHMWHTRPVQGPTDNLVLLDWEFSPTPFPETDRPQWQIEGFSPKLNLRKVLKADEGYIIVSCDYSGQELRVPTNLSKEPVWTHAFLSGDDVHKATATQIWGAEAYDKDKRRKAKAGAFGLLYGGNEYTMQKNLNLTEQEAKDFVSSFKRALPTLFNYFDAVVKMARKNHTVYTYFGHPRRLRYFYRHQDRRFWGFADRTAMNSPIQGAGADILKIALIKLWMNLYNHPDWKDDCNFMSTVHDEVNSQVKIERLKEFMHKKEELMQLSIQGWDVPMEVSVGVGYSWGELFDFKFNKETNSWIPKKEPEPWVPKEKAVSHNTDTTETSADDYDFFQDDEEEEEDIY